MTKIKSILFLSIGLSILAALPLASAQNNPGADEMSPKVREQHAEEIYRRLDLTDEQKRQLTTNKQQHQAKMESARQEIKKDKDALRGEIMKSSLDMSKVNQIHEQIKLLQNQMEDDKLASILAVRAILTPEQFTEFVNLMHKHKQDHE